MIDGTLLAARWYLVMLLIGAAGLLPSAQLFDRLHSNGVLYARPLALAVIALAAWLLGWSRWVPYGTPVVAGVVIALLAWSAVLAWLREDLVAAVLSRARLLLAGEGLYLAVFALMTWARSVAPAATSTEKPMDLMLIEAVHRAPVLPPPDPWLAGHTISYYHLGHLGADAVGRLAGLPSEVTFNLVTASAGALAAVAAAALAVDVIGLGAIRRGRTLWIAAGVTVATLLLVTPLVGLVNLLAANGAGHDIWHALGVRGVPGARGAVNGIPEAFWWWWNSTRVLPGTISEFPAFTLLLGDPHAHLLALPIDLVAGALALTVFEGSRPLTWRRWARDPERLLLTSTVFAAICLTNAWDVVLFGAIWAAAGVAAFRRAGWPWILGLTGVARWAAAPIAIALVFAGPFLTGIDPPRLGLAPVTGEHSDPVRWLLVWLPPILPAALALALLRPALPRATFARAFLVVGLPLEAWVIALIVRGNATELLARGAGWLTLLGLVAAIAAAGAIFSRVDRSDAEGGRDPALSAACGLVVVVAVILGLTEIVRVADAFPGRLNTVFKFWFAAWALLAVGAGTLAGLAVERMRPTEGAGARHRVGRGLALGAAGALLVATALYVPAMAVSRSREGAGHGLNALRYLEESDAGLAATIAWSRDHLDPREDVAMQAITESYRGGNMLAAASGVPTLLGWPNHQRQWRGVVPEDERRTAVDAIYAGGATPASLETARRYGVTYVYIGREERAQYGAAVGTRFEAWPVAFAAGGATLVRVP